MSILLLLSGLLGTQPRASATDHLEERRCSETLAMRSWLFKNRALRSPRPAAMWLSHDHTTNGISILFFVGKLLQRQRSGLSPRQIFDGSLSEAEALAALGVNVLRRAGNIAIVDNASNRKGATNWLEILVQEYFAYGEPGAAGLILTLAHGVRLAIIPEPLLSSLSNDLQEKIVSHENKEIALGAHDTAVEAHDALYGPGDFANVSRAIIQHLVEPQKPLPLRLTPSASLDFTDFFRTGFAEIVLDGERFVFLMDSFNSRDPAGIFFIEVFQVLQEKPGEPATLQRAGYADFQLDEINGILGTSARYLRGMRLTSDATAFLRDHLLQGPNELADLQRSSNRFTTSYEGHRRAAFRVYDRYQKRGLGHFLFASVLETTRLAGRSRLDVLSTTDMGEGIYSRFVAKSVREQALRTNRNIILHLGYTTTDAPDDRFRIERRQDGHILFHLYPHTTSLYSPNARATVENHLRRWNNVDGFLEQRVEAAIAAQNAGLQPYLELTAKDGKASFVPAGNRPGQENTVMGNLARWLNETIVLVAQPTESARVVILDDTWATVPDLPACWIQTSPDQPLPILVIRYTPLSFAREGNLPAILALLHDAHHLHHRQSHTRLERDIDAVIDMELRTLFDLLRSGAPSPFAGHDDRHSDFFREALAEALQLADRPWPLIALHIRPMVEHYVRLEQASPMTIATERDNDNRFEDLQPLVIRERYKNMTLYELGSRALPDIIWIESDDEPDLQGMKTFLYKGADVESVIASILEIRQRLDALMFRLTGNLPATFENANWIEKTTLLLTALLDSDLSWADTELYRREFEDHIFPFMDKMGYKGINTIPGWDKKFFYAISEFVELEEDQPEEEIAYVFHQRLLHLLDWFPDLYSLVRSVFGAHLRSDFQTDDVQFDLPNYPKLIESLHSVFDTKEPGHPTIWSEKELEGVRSLFSLLLIIPDEDDFYQKHKDNIAPPIEIYEPFFEALADELLHRGVPLRRWLQIAAESPIGKMPSSGLMFAGSKLATTDLLQIAAFADPTLTAEDVFLERNSNGYASYAAEHDVLPSSHREFLQAVLHWLLEGHFNGPSRTDQGSDYLYWRRAFSLFPESPEVTHLHSSSATLAQQA